MNLALFQVALHPAQQGGQFSLDLPLSRTLAQVGAAVSVLSLAGGHEFTSCSQRTTSWPP